MKHNTSISGEVVMLLWMVLCVGLMMFFGILPSIFVFVLAYMRYQGKQSWRNSLLASIGSLLFVIGVFEILLQYNLYRGALFDPRGFDAW
jgi:predicted membrane protein